MAKKQRLPIAKSTGDYPCAPPKPTKDQKDQERRWKAEDGLRTIQRAEEVKRDKKLMGDIKALASEQVSNLKKFCK